VIAYRPYRWQAEPWKSTAKILVLSGGSGSGKSRLAAEKCHALAQKYQGSMGLVVRKMRESLKNSTLLFLETEVDPDFFLSAHEKSAHRYKYANKSYLAYGGMCDEKQRQAIRSIGSKGGLDFVWLEEANAFTLDDFEELRTRMRGRAMGWTQIILTTNPDSSQHWINQTLIQPFLNGKFKPHEVQCFFSLPEQNENIDPEYLATLKSLTGVRRDRFLLGKWVQAEGVVYEEWNPDNVHVIDPFELDPSWRRIRVVDFGHSVPMVIQWHAIDPDGRIFVYRETYKTKTLVEDRTKEAVALTKEKNEVIEATICDHDAEARATMERHGIPTRAAYKDVLRGIENVTQRLRLTENGLGQKKPRLSIFRNALCHEPDEDLVRQKKPFSTISEMDGYVWSRNPDGSVKKDEPRKEDDHGNDCLRYGCAYVDRLSAMVNAKAVMQQAAQAREQFGRAIEAFKPSW
jgi:PBSX family phage terminase large subunit